MKRRQDLREAHFESNLKDVRVQTSALFLWLLLGQWVLAIAIASMVSPYAWEGRAESVRVHVETAVFLGALINLLPFVLIRSRPRWWLTPHAVAVAQMLWSGLLIHLTGGQFETHFHVFGSLAFLAFYRDWKVILTATLVVAADHLIRGLFWPESIYGLAHPAWWQLLGHAAWIAFEDSVLVLGCLRSLAEMRMAADREARLEVLNVDIEGKVRRRTAELLIANGAIAHEMKTRLQAEAELRQAQKLEAVGRLASGVAHEINTPVQFVSDSVHFLRDATRALIGTLEKLRTLRRAVSASGAFAEEATAAAEAEEAADLDYLFENAPKAVERSLEGLGRVTTIVKSMKEFAHPDTAEMIATDLNHAIASTLIIARNEYKYVADVETVFGALPPVFCYPGEVNQTVLNIVVNAAHAIEELVKGTEKRGTISVKTSVEGELVVVAISDSGGGIPETIRDRIFDPFFTTKEVGKGTGQGLAIARSVVVDKHGGELSLTSEVGKGTTFFIRLPFAGRSRPRDAGEAAA
jgi:signal transduction histidine kinase